MALPLAGKLGKPHAPPNLDNVDGSTSEAARQFWIACRRVVYDRLPDASCERVGVRWPTVHGIAPLNAWTACANSRAAADRSSHAARIAATASLMSGLRSGEYGASLAAS